MEIRQVDLGDDAAMHAAFTVTDAARSFGREGMPRMTEAEWTVAMRTGDSGEREELWLAYDDGRAVGGAVAYFPLLDNVHMVYGGVEVVPEARRRGVGAALLERLEQQARADPGARTLLLGDAKVPGDQVETHPYRRFADAHGFEFGNVEVVRHQPLPVGTEQLDAWEAELADRTAGYTFSTYVNDFPAELAPSLCTLLGLLAVDAPTGAVDFEEEAMTPERLRERHDRLRAMGREGFETVAVKEGVVCAQTTLSVSPDQPDAFQWGTYVHREHRGHALGMAVKVANLRAVQTAHPHVRRATTQNAETNQWMIAINEKLGFRVVEASVEFVKRL